MPPTHLGRFFSSRKHLDAYKIPQPLDIALLKSDTEGYEAIVFETALSILPRIRNILVEVYPSRWARNAISVERGNAIFECFFAAGMEAIDLPRKDVDYIVPGDIDLANLPHGRLHASWPEFKAILDLALLGKNGLVNPNFWFRWSPGGEKRRQVLEISQLQACNISLTYADD